MGQTQMRGAGGTPGGVGQFFIGLGMAGSGAYLLMSQVTVSTSYWKLWGYNSFGVSLLPLMFGIGLLFFNGRSMLGWLLLLVGAVIIFAAILMNLQIYFQPTSLFNTLLMLVMLAAGMGLLLRGLRSRAAPSFY